MKSILVLYHPTVRRENSKIVFTRGIGFAHAMLRFGVPGRIEVPIPESYTSGQYHVGGSAEDVTHLDQ